jgi:hypothetical protein
MITPLVYNTRFLTVRCAPAFTILHTLVAIAIYITWRMIGALRASQLPGFVIIEGTNHVTLFFMSSDRIGLMKYSKQRYTSIMM